MTMLLYECSKVRIKATLDCLQTVVSTCARVRLLLQLCFSLNIVHHSSRGMFPGWSPPDLTTLDGSTSMKCRLGVTMYLRD